MNKISQVNMAGGLSAGVILVEGFAQRELRSAGQTYWSVVQQAQHL